MRMTHRNLLFVRRHHGKGVPIGEIFRKCADNLGWDGPLPSIEDIEAITRSPAQPSAPVEPGPTEAGHLIGAGGPGE